MSTADAIRIHENGGLDVLKFERIDVPAPGPGEAKIRQTAIGLNFIDVYTRTGLYPSKLPAILGSEAAGVVEEVGDGVTGLKPGDRVVYNGVPGAYATRRTLPAAKLIQIPDAVSDEAAAALFLKGLTAWMLMFEIRRPQPGETVLVWAAAGGVGSILVPWANALGARVIGVVSSEEKAAVARGYGCAEVVLSGEDVAARVRELTGGKGVPVVYDSVGKMSAEHSLKSLAPKGWFVTYGNASGPVDPMPPLRLSQGGSLIMTRPTLFSYTSERADLERGSAALWGAVRSGAVRADIRQKFALADVASAHKALESRATQGSTVLIP
jgi:NADPH2:quinone reductase